MTLLVSYLEAPTCVPTMPLPYSIQRCLSIPDWTEHAVLAMTQTLLLVQSRSIEQAQQALQCTADYCC